MPNLTPEQSAKAECCQPWGTEDEYDHPWYTEHELGQVTCDLEHHAKHAAHYAFRVAGLIEDLNHTSLGFVLAKDMHQIHVDRMLSILEAQYRQRDDFELLEDEMAIERVRNSL